MFKQYESGTEMKLKLILVSFFPAMGVFFLGFLAAAQTSLSDGASVLIALTFAGIAFLIALVGLISVRLLTVAEKINRKMVTKDRVEQLDRNSRRENRRELANLFHQVESTIQLESVFGFAHPLPPSRSWAASPDLIVEILNQIRDRKPQLIVELGSGLSTVWIARVLEQNGFGKLVSIDHEAHFAEKTRAQLAVHGLESLVDLRVGALEEQRWVDGTQSWYPQGLFDGLEKIDLLIVDGPPRNDTETYRWPAMWELETRMNSSATIILDDVIRQEEADLAKAWAERGNYKLEIKFLEKRAGILSR